MEQGIVQIQKKKGHALIVIKKAIWQGTVQSQESLEKAEVVANIKSHVSIVI